MRSAAPHHQAPPLQRPTATFTLRFGHLAVPVAAYAALKGGRSLARSEFTADEHPVGRLPYDKVTGAVLHRSQVRATMRGADDRHVVLDDDDLDRLFASERKNAHVEALVPLGALSDGTYCIDSMYHLRARPPSRRDPAVGASDRLAVVLAALGDRGVAALIRPVLTGRLPRCAVVTPGGWLLGLAFASEVRGAPPPPPLRGHHGVELEQARRFIDAMGVSLPILEDHARATVADYLATKARTTSWTAVGRPGGPVIDLGVVDGVFAARGRGGFPRRRPRRRRR